MHVELLKILGDGGYARYDESTAERRLLLSKALIDDYGGHLRGMVEASASRADCFTSKVSVR